MASHHSGCDRCRSLVFALPDLWPGASYVITFTVNVTDDIPTGTLVVTNAATIGSNQVDSDPNDNTGRAILPTAGGYSALHRQHGQSPSATPTQPGDLILYTLAYGNAGNTSALTATITSTLPANTAFRDRHAGVVL